MWNSVASRSSRRVADHEIECAGRHFTESHVAVERNRDTDGGILASEPEAAFE